MTNQRHWHVDETDLLRSSKGFSIVRGEEFLKTYHDPETDSGTQLDRIFCRECGSTLFALTALWSEIVSIAAGTLDDFASWRPDVEQYCIHRAEFLEKLKGISDEKRFDKAVNQQAM